MTTSGVVLRARARLEALSDEPLDYRGHGAAAGLGAGGQVSHQLAVQAPGLSAGGLKAPVRREVGVDRHEPAFQRDRSHEAQEERLSRTEIAHNEPEGRTAIRNAIDVRHDGRHLVGSTDLDVLETTRRHHAGAQGVDDGGAHARPNGCRGAGGGRHHHALRVASLASTPITWPAADCQSSAKTRATPSSTVLNFLRSSSAA